MTRNSLALARATLVRIVLSFCPTQATVRRVRQRRSVPALGDRLTPAPAGVWGEPRNYSGNTEGRLLVDYLGYGLALEGMSVVDRTVTSGG
jgi:hypothetical protein